MPYGPREQVLSRIYKALIAEINRRAPVFTIHIGDTKSGTEPCSDELLLEQRDFMNSFASALVYTPGDNEWTDCHRLLAGAYDPLERLHFIRRHYFPADENLGGRPIRLERQADVMPGFEPFVENSRFNWRGVWFMTAHVVGSNNNFDAVEGSDATAEFLVRDEANREWLADSFDRATAADAGAVVIAIHADMFRDGFHPKQETFRPIPGTSASPRPSWRRQDPSETGPLAVRGQSRVPGLSSLPPHGRQPDRRGGLWRGTHARGRDRGRYGHGSRVHVQSRAEPRPAHPVVGQFEFGSS